LKKRSLFWDFYFMRFPTPREREHLKDLLVVLTQKEVKLRYRSSWLGYLWSVANPLAFAILYFVAFSVFMRVDIPRYPLFLIAGLFPWQWIANSMNAAPNLFLTNTSLIKKVRFPRNVLIASAVLNDGIHFLCSIPVLGVFLVAYGSYPSWSWFIGVPLLAIGQLVLVYGLAITIASLNLFLRDLERLTNLVVTFLFFLTPIVYSESMIPNKYHALLYLNPTAPFILCWRELFFSGRLDWPGIAVGYLYATAACVIGSAIYAKLSWKFAEVV
jgi:lipopolysaccharide transport system permease protein